jgi:hypothetical protein
MAYNKNNGCLVAQECFIFEELSTFITTLKRQQFILKTITKSNDFFKSTANQLKTFSNPFACRSRNKIIF